MSNHGMQNSYRLASKFMNERFMPPVALATQKPLVNLFLVLEQPANFSPNKQLLSGGWEGKAAFCFEA